MFKILTNIRFSFKKIPLLSSAYLASAIFGIYWGMAANNGEWDSPLALALLVIISGYFALGEIAKSAARKKAANAAYFCAFAAVTAMLIALRLESGILKNAALLIGWTGIFFFFSGWKGTMKIIFPLVCTFILLPFQENIMLAISYPLRLVSTAAAVSVMQIFGADVSANLSTIYAGSGTIAITDACSGISQLGVLLFFAYVFSLRLKSNYAWKISYFIFILPIVIFANAVRLIITITLFLTAGDIAFDDTIHVSLGYFFVALSTVLLWYATYIIPTEKKDTEE